MDRTLISVPALALARVLRCLATMKAELTPDALLYHELVRTGETLCLLRTKEAIQSRPRVSGTDRKEQVDVDHAGVDEVTATNRDERTDPGLRSQKPVATARRTRSSVLYSTDVKITSRDPRQPKPRCDARFQPRASARSDTATGRREKDRHAG